VPNALVELWQVQCLAARLHSCVDQSSGALDPNLRRRPAPPVP